MSFNPRTGVYYDLKESTHLERIDYVNTTIIYVFSSELYRSKFAEKVKSNRETINNSLTKRFDLKVNVNMLADIVLYKKIEKRGFYLLINGESVECQSNIVLDGLRMMS